MDGSRFSSQGCCLTECEKDVGMRLCQIICDLCFHASSLTCLHTFWHAFHPSHSHSPSPSPTSRTTMRHSWWSHTKPRQATPQPAGRVGVPGGCQGPPMLWHVPVCSTSEQLNNQIRQGRKVALSCGFS